ncbi:ribosome silencing factor [Campylobacter sputorum]|uniref:ribosome silencing factor n=1 Tax=Campylobacter sputorum TaxID=206 RepID=UPI00053BFA06|nr:ribosome silencing factor [Campylobacter sputorum]
MNQRIENIIKILDEKKAEEIQFFDMSKDEYFVDYVIIATTLGAKHSLALIDELKNQLKPQKEEFLNVEISDEWSVIDLGDIVIHLFDPAYRAKYNIEELLEQIKEMKEKAIY